MYKTSNVFQIPYDLDGFGTCCEAHNYFVPVAISKRRKINDETRIQKKIFKNRTNHENHKRNPENKKRKLVFFSGFFLASSLPEPNPANI